MRTNPSRTAPAPKSSTAPARSARAAVPLISATRRPKIAASTFHPRTHAHRAPQFHPTRLRHLTKLRLHPRELVLQVLHMRIPLEHGGLGFSQRPRRLRDLPVPLLYLRRQPPLRILRPLGLF